MNWFRSRYVVNLERQIADLKQEKIELQKRIDSLVGVLVPRLQQPVQAQASVVAPAIPPKKHKITKAPDNQSAKCDCGWKFATDDPVDLQNAISQHYRQSFVPLKMNRISWSAGDGIRAKLENLEQDPLLVEKKA